MVIGTRSAAKFEQVPRSNDYSVGDGPSCDDEGNIMMMMEMIIKRSMVEIWSSRLEVTVCNFLQHQTRPYAHFSIFH